jgi:drug/metabolite transporter (DMT)-like permease
MIAIPLLHEQLTAMQWIGTLVIIGTIVVMTRLRDDQQPAAQGSTSLRTPAA